MAWKVNPTHLLMWYSNNGCKIMDRLCCFSYMDEQVFGEAESHDYYFKRKPTMVPTEWIDDYDDKENVVNDANKPISTMELLSRTKVIAAAATSTISICLNNTRDKNINDGTSKIPSNELDKGYRQTISSSPTAVTSVSTSSSFGTMTTVSMNSKESQNNSSCNSRNNSYDTQSTYPMTNVSTPQGQQQEQDHYRQQGNLFDDDEDDDEQRNDEENDDDNDMSKSCYSSSPSKDKPSKCNSSPSTSPSKMMMNLLASSCQGNNMDNDNDNNNNMNRLELVGDRSSPCNRPSISFSKRFASSAFHDDASNTKKQRRYRRYQRREQENQQENQDRDDFNKMLRHIQTEGLVHLPHLRTSNIRYEC